MTGQEDVASRCARGGKLRLDIRKDFCSERLVKCWNKRVVESPSPEMLRKRGLCAMV